jgi:hypothetical protein
MSDSSGGPSPSRREVLGALAVTPTLALPTAPTEPAISAVQTHVDQRRADSKLAFAIAEHLINAYSSAHLSFRPDLDRLSAACQGLDTTTVQFDLQNSTGAKLSDFNQETVRNRVKQLLNVSNTAYIMIYLQATTDGAINVTCTIGPLGPSDSF